MDVLLHSSTHLPPPSRTVSASRTRALELWLLTAFLFMLLIVGRFTSHSTTKHRPAQLPTSASLLRKTVPPYSVPPCHLAPFIEPTALR